MRVLLEWTEEVSYRSTIEVDEAAVRLWLTMDHKGIYHPEKNDPATPLTDEEILDYLQSGEEEDWFESCDAVRDFYGVMDRKIESVEVK